MKDNKQIKLTINTENLSSEQVELLQEINFLSVELMKTDCEVSFFEKSSLLMKLMAKVIGQSNFGKADPFEPIPYAKQALEYSIESLEA